MNVSKQLPGRPRGFDIDQALDVAIEGFWRHGYEGFDMNTLAAAIGTSKPALYRVFHDKAALFLRAIERYSQPGLERPSQSYFAAASLYEAVEAFLAGVIAKSLKPGLPAGCLLSVVAAVSPVPEARKLCQQSLEHLAGALMPRMAAECSDLALQRVTAEARTWLLIDIAQAFAIRSRMGFEREAMLASVPSYARLVIE